MKFRLVKGFSNVFINEYDGSLFTVKNGKDVILTPQPHHEKPTISIQGKVYLIINLVLATFDFKYSDTDRITYKISKSGFISPKGVKIKSVGNLSNEDDFLCIKYRCDIKSSSANSRFKDKISKGTILQILKIAEYKCVYCGTDIKPEDWHLDHYHPKSAGGRNTMENIAPACSTCNLMKGALDGIEFLNRCKKICMYNKIFSQEEINKFSTDWSAVSKHREEIDRKKKSFDMRKRDKDRSMRLDTVNGNV